MSAGEVLLGVLALPFLVAAVIIPILLLDGFVVQKLWNWFVVEQFNTAKIPYAVAIGLSTLAGFMTRTFVWKPAEREEDISLWINYVIGTPLLTLLIGYIVHLYV